MFKDLQLCHCALIDDWTRAVQDCAKRSSSNLCQYFLQPYDLLEYEQILYIRRANICLYNFQINFILSNLNQTCNEARDEHFTGPDHHSLYIWTSIGLSIQSESKYLLNKYYLVSLRCKYKLHYLKESILFICRKLYHHKWSSLWQIKKYWKSWINMKSKWAMLQDSHRILNMTLLW